MNKDRSEKINKCRLHSKTLSYSIWHIFRIEDIVAHEMIAEDEQILFRNGDSNTAKEQALYIKEHCKKELIKKFLK